MYEASEFEAYIATAPSLQSPKMDIYSFGILMVETCMHPGPDCENLIASLHDKHCVDLIQRCLQLTLEITQEIAQLHYLRSIVAT